MDDNSEVNKSKGRKKCIIKCLLCLFTLFNDKIILKLQQRFKSDQQKVYTEEVNKIALSSDDDKRLQTFSRITTYPYGTPAVKVYENQTVVVKDLFVKKYVDCPFYGKTVLKQ